MGFVSSLCETFEAAAGHVTIMPEVGNGCQEPFSVELFLESSVSGGPTASAVPLQ